MQAERWKGVEQLYEAAVALPADERAGFLDKACPDDPRLRAEVQSLLDQQTDGFLEDSPLSLSLHKGARLGSFEMLERIGRGGMGDVWRARDTRLNRNVAIKLLPGAFARDPDRITRFEREARAASALNHPNVVSVFDIGSENGVRWIVTELVDGESLRTLISRGPLPPRKVVEIGAQIADGLAAAHEAGIVHRDLKPANIMLSRDNRVKIVDFGLAKRGRRASESITLTDPGVVLGTVGYMSPEQVRGESVDARSDIFSFGVILYEMLSGRQAFPGTSSVEVMNSILTDEPAELPASIAAVLERIVRRCLEKLPARRFQSVADLGFALTTSVAPSTPASGVKRRLWPIWSAIAAALLAAMVITYLETVRRPERAAWVSSGTLRQLTNDPGLTTNAAISPDGRFVAYSSDRADPNNLDIWLQQVEGGHPVRITNDPADDDQPTFSPDGTQIAFWSARATGGIYIVPVLGGEARLLIPNGRRPQFSPNGEMLMYSNSSGNALFIQGLQGGVPVRIGAECAAWGMYTGTAVWSPDSKHILFYAQSCPEGRGFLISTLDNRRKLVANAERLNFEEIDAWLSNPSRLLFPLRFAEGASVVASPISDDGAKLTGLWQTLTFGTGKERHASAASTGRIALSCVNSDQHIWGVPIDTTGHATGSAMPLTVGVASDYAPSLSRDGRGLAFTSRRTGGLKLYYLDFTSGKQRELADSGYPGSVFSSDDTRIIFLGRGPRFLPLEQVPLSGAVPMKITEPNQGISPWDWSPDGGSVLSSSKDLGRVHILDLATLSITPFLQDPQYRVWQAHFSHDGRWVAFNSEREGYSRVFVAPFRKALVPRGEWIQITDGQSDDKPRFSSDDKLIFFVSDRDGFRCIWGQSLGENLRPVGSPFAVYHSHQRRRSLGNINLEHFAMDVGRKMIVFNQADLTGSIWVLDPGKAAAK